MFQQNAAYLPGLVGLHFIADGRLNVYQFLNARFGKHMVATTYPFSKTEQFQQRKHGGKVKVLVALCGEKPCYKLLPLTHTAFPSNVLAELECTNTFT